ncbi:MAG: TusE/DsrC/DsvC family sulfur relay protein [Chitinophagaceae bacterium]
MEKTIAGKSIAVNEEGYLTDFKQWDKSVGEALAAEAEINLTPQALGCAELSANRAQE